MGPSEFKWLLYDALKASVYMVGWVILTLTTTTINLVRGVFVKH